MDILGHETESLYVKASKCEFGRRELGFLGHRFSVARVAVNPRKVAAVRIWPIPTSKVDLSTGSSGFATFVAGF